MKWSATGIMVLIAGFTALFAWRTLAIDNSASSPIGLQRVFAGSTLPIETVESVVLEREGEVSHIFEGSDAGWRQSEPFDVGVNGMAVRELIIAAADLVSSKAIAISALEEGTTLASLGLDPPLAKIRLTAGERSEVFDLGRRTVAGRAWMRLGGAEEVLLVNDALHAIGLDQDVRTWRRRELFDFTGDPITITLTNGPVITVLHRNGNLWELSSPVRSRANGEAIARLIAVLGRVSHDGVVLDTTDLEPFGLDTPAATVSLKSERGDERLLIGTAVGVSGRERYAGIDGMPSVVRLSEATLQALLPRVETLIAATSTGVRAADVKTIEIVASEGGSVLLERNLDTWRIQRTLVSGDTVSGEALHVMVEQLLELVCQARATEVVVQAFPMDLARANITLSGYDGMPLDTIRVAQEGAEGRWAIDNGEGVLRIFPTSTVLPIEPSDWPVK